VAKASLTACEAVNATLFSEFLNERSTVQEQQKEIDAL
jgi:hypothetical protein